MLLLPDDALSERRAAVRAGGPLAPLFDSLAVELSPWLTSAPYLPAEKALLSRQGGRCESCGTMLEFDPASPREHRCPSCGRVHTGALHDRAWVMPYQLWLAERALHGALFHLLRGDRAHAQFARDTLRSYADRYASYPNVDNVLGPTRLFFSTYLESIWLLQICCAADCLAAADDAATSDLVADRIVAPSRAIIAGYDEGMSNRQVWNNAALIASARMLRREHELDALVHGPSGVERHLERALLADGTWYEGENYHQFALRGLWYCVTMLEAAGASLRPDLRDRFQRAFAAPFVTALPDFTMPARKDSQYAVSLRQWRIAELTELGFARRQDAALGGGLARMYQETGERRDTGRARSTADVERNSPSTRLTRADLGWRALLHALPELPAVKPLRPRSALLESQGYAVFRRDRDVYVGFEFGQSGGGHGHPDRLNVTLYQGENRWLDDYGTGSYVDPSLHWYRSTLAHNAPMVNGVSQPLRDGRLLAWDEREGLGWIVAEFDIPQLDVRLERALVVAPDYLISELRWTARTPVRVDLPWHFDARPPGITLEPTAHDAEPAPWARIHGLGRWGGAQPSPMVSATRQDTQMHLLLAGESRDEILVGEAPGQPFNRCHRVFIHRAHGSDGCVRAVMSWNATSCAWRPDHPLAIEVGGERHIHRRDEKGWHVELHAGGAHSSVDLTGFRRTSPAVIPSSPPQRTPMRLHRRRITAEWLTDLPARQGWLVYELGESHYRRSEPSWRDAGSPAATIAIGADGVRVVVFADICAGDPVFAAADAENPFDNEHADTMRAGMQLYLDDNGWMLVPEENGGRVRLRRLSGGAEILTEAAWRRTAAGYEMRVVLSPRRDAFSMDVIVNETVRGRERRRGQLVMSGARGETVYLRGDRHDAVRLVPMSVVP